MSTNEKPPDQTTPSRREELIAAVAKVGVHEAVRRIESIAIEQRIAAKQTTPKTAHDAHEVWLRMVSIWESTPSLEAVTEMAHLLKTEGWTDAKAT